MLHSDQGWLYRIPAWKRLLEGHSLTQSMSRKGNCLDNAPMESFWGLLKNELVHHRRYQTRREAVQDITEYIEILALPGFPWVADLLMSFPEGTNEGYGPIFSDSRADRALVC